MYLLLKSYPQQSEVMAKKTKLNPYRIATQWIILFLLLYLVVRPYINRSYTSDFEAYCPFGGLQAFSSFLVSNSLACSMTTTQIFMGLGLVVAVILISKLFCSYICPIGSFTEWLSRIGRKLKVNFEIKGTADRLLRILKYGLLFLTFYFTLTSSELFCKTFDPYYAVFSGFSSDVVISYASLALLLAIPGSLFIRQAWCRYACPLGAASNILSNSLVFIGITAVYAFLVLVLKLQISWIWLLSTLAITGVLFETFKVNIKGLSIFRISRNTDSCTGCKLCDKVCPMAIKVSELNTVKDIDCHLCGDCVVSCPEENTLSIIGNKKLAGNVKRKQFITALPAVLVCVIVIAGLGFSQKIHIPTISLKWGNQQQLSSAGIYEQSGLTSIKCFGSSMSFANHMKEVKGVMGLETYVGSHSVRVWYDKSITNANNIKEAIFTPYKRLFAAPALNQKAIGVCDASIDNFFDPNDAGLLSTRFEQNKGILAMQTMFGEPVKALIYYDPALITPAKISTLIEQKKVKWTVDGEEYEADTRFKVSVLIPNNNLSLKEYLTLLYQPVSMTFNGYNDYDQKEIEVYRFAFNQASDPALTDMPWYLLSHVSNNRNVVGFELVPEAEGFVLDLKVIKNKVGKDELVTMMNSPNLTVHLSDGTTQVLKNPYRF